MTDFELLKSASEPKPRRFWWHWQNLNDRSDGSQGSGFRHGRCWWHFGDYHKSIQFSWNFWTHFFGVDLDIGDEDVTLMLACPPVAFWLSFNTAFSWLRKILPTRPLDYYPETIVIDERECGIRIHGGTVWLKFWCRSGGWRKSDPWWARGVSFSINPFEWKHLAHEVRRADGSWAPFIGSWEQDKGSDSRETFEYPYRYVFANGTVQDRTATVFVNRREWRPRCLQWTSLFAKRRQSIDVVFSEEVGEKSGSWKGGCTGCGYEMLRGETPEQTLRRMEKERRFR